MRTFRALALQLKRRRLGLFANLWGVAGHTGRGRFAYFSYPEGYAVRHVTLKGLAGLRAEVWHADALIGRVALVNGRASGILDSRASGVSALGLEGDLVEIRQHGDVILRGILRRFRFFAAPKGTRPA